MEVKRDDGGEEGVRQTVEEKDKMNEVRGVLGKRQVLIWSRPFRPRPHLREPDLNGSWTCGSLARAAADHCGTWLGALLIATRRLVRVRLRLGVVRGRPVDESLSERAF